MRDRGAELEALVVLRHEDAAHVRVALEVLADPPKPGQVLERKVAVLGQRRILNRRRVTLAEHESVPARPFGMIRIVAQHPVVQRRDDVRGRKRGVQVSGLGHREHPHAVDSQHGGPSLQLGDPRLRLDAVRKLRRRLRVGDRPQVGHFGEVSARRHRGSGVARRGGCHLALRLCARVDGTNSSGLGRGAGSGGGGRRVAVTVR